MSVSTYYAHIKVKPQNVKQRITHVSCSSITRYNPRTMKAYPDKSLDANVHSSIIYIAKTANNPNAHQRVSRRIKCTIIQPQEGQKSWRVTRNGWTWRHGLNESSSHKRPQSVWCHGQDPPRRGQATDRKEIRGCPGLGVGSGRNGARPLMAMGLLFWWWKYSKIRYWQQSHNFVNILETTE